MARVSDNILVPSLVLLLCNVIILVNCDLPTKIFDVVEYGAVADGETVAVNSQALEKAWKDACAYDGTSRVLIPNGTFMMGSVSLEGWCMGSMVFVLRGNLKAPTEDFFTDTWIGFRNVRNLTVRGGGTFDGQGHVAWPYNDCNKTTNCKTLPVTLRLEYVDNAKVYNVHSIDSKGTHFHVFASTNVKITNVRLVAPAVSPNTDGIHVGLSTGIAISHSQIATGDDCISMVSGTQKVNIFNVTCGPGHGISIGSLGRTQGPKDSVSRITVRNCTFVESDNGVRIKTWAPSRYNVASDILFQDIHMRNPRFPIVIDQEYCPSADCPKSSSDVQIKDVTFKNIWGVSSSEIAVNLICSSTKPCKNVTLVDIDLGYSGAGKQAKARCSNVIGSAYGKMIPAGCL